MNQRSLKILALITMIIDHFGAAVLYLIITRQGRTDLIKAYYAVRSVGRIAFPLYCYMLVEGFKYTRNIKRYIATMGIFAVISELPFNYAVGHCVWIFPEHQNVYFTLVLSLVAMLIIRYAEKTYDVSNEKRYFFIAAAIGAMAGLSYLLKTDYKASGVLAVCAMYLIEQYKSVILPATVLSNKEISDRFVRFLQLFIGSLILALMASSKLEYWALTSAVIIIFYNGKRGKYLSKYFYYLAYPVHLAIFGYVAWTIF